MCSGSSIYVDKLDLRRVKRSCKTRTELAMNLMELVFTDNALNDCSVKGRLATGKGKENATRRPGLHSKGVDAILGTKF